jgi:hypothetical protein
MSGMVTRRRKIGKDAGIAGALHVATDRVATVAAGGRYASPGIVRWRRGRLRWPSGQGGTDDITATIHIGRTTTATNGRQRYPRTPATR